MTPATPGPTGTSKRHTGDQPMTNVTRIIPRSKSQADPPHSAPSDSRLWSIHETSEFLGVPVNTIYQWRATGSGPKAYKLGKHLRYDPADIRAWLQTRVA